MRGGDLEALHAASERAFVARLGDQMHVIALEGDLADAEVGSPKRRRQRTADRVICIVLAQAAYRTLDAQRDLHRAARGQGFTLLVTFARAEALPGSTGAFALSAALGERKRLLDVMLARPLDMQSR